MPYMPKNHSISPYNGRPMNVSELLVCAMKEDPDSGDYCLTEDGEEVEFVDVMVMNQNADGMGTNEPTIELENLSTKEGMLVAIELSKELDLDPIFLGCQTFAEITLSAFPDK